MSVRRLAEDSVQPAGFAFSADNANWAKAAIAKFPDGRQQSAVIPLLMRAQEQDGWVTKAAIEHIAGMLEMPLIRVLEVATFYTQFQLKPVGTRAHIQVCGTTPCMLRGSDDLKRVCQKRIHDEQFHLNASGTLSWEEVECLGACVNAPMVMVFKDTYEDLTAERLEAMIDAFERGEPVPAGPQIDRHLSAPEGGPTTLTGRAADEPATDGGPAAGAPAQGPGAGAAINGDQSKAGRPRTTAAETDPTLDVPGKATNGNVDQKVEAAVSIDPGKGAGAAGAGETGGTVRGPTGGGGKEVGGENTGSVSADLDVVRTDGKLNSAEARAEAAVVPDRARGDAPDRAPPVSDTALLTGRTPGSPVENNRTSEDVLPGTMTGDHFEAKPAAGTAAGGESHLETAGPVHPGEKPDGLLAAPAGEKDNLQVIRGIGPVIEARLNELGVFHLRQIAAWTAMELIWVDEYLNFRGRAVRENWVRQAKELTGQNPSETL